MGPAGDKSPVGHRLRSLELVRLNCTDAPVITYVQSVGVRPCVLEDLVGSMRRSRRRRRRAGTEQVGDHRSQASAEKEGLLVIERQFPNVCSCRLQGSVTLGDDVCARRRNPGAALVGGQGHRDANEFHARLVDLGEGTTPAIRVLKGFTHGSLKLGRHQSLVLVLAVGEAGVTFAALCNRVSACLELADVLGGEVGIITVTHFQDFVEARQDPLVDGMQSQVEEVRRQGTSLRDSLGSPDVMHRALRIREVQVIRPVVEGPDKGSKLREGLFGPGGTGGSDGLGLLQTS